MEKVDGTEINEDFWFLSNCKGSISHLKTGLDTYINNFEKAISLKEYPIFLDANVLLYFYKVSNVVKKNFIDFLNENKGRIYITEHIKNEFLRSRIRVINKDYLNVLKSTPADLQKRINSISSFINSNKTLLSDYGEIFSELQEIESNLINTYKRLSFEIKKDLERNKNIKYHDPLLEAYSEIEVISNISEKELSFIKEKFNSLSKKDISVYPGMEDIKNKNSNYEGDFLIFHEIMKYMKEHNTSVTFLTNDVKVDWFEIDDQKKRHPHIPYIEVTYNNTGEFNYILEANRTLSDLLDIKIVSNTYQKKCAKENKILREKTFTASWVDDIFRDYLNDYHLDDFSHSMSEIDIEYDVELSDLDFDSLLDHNESSADFNGSGVATNTSTDENGNDVSFKIEFGFSGTCEINTEYKSVDIFDLDISDYGIEVD